MRVSEATLCYCFDAVVIEFTHGYGHPESRFKDIWVEIQYLLDQIFSQRGFA